MSDEASIEAAMRAVVEDMGNAARKFKAKRYEPKEKPPEAAPAPVAEDESGMPTASELESMLTEG